MLHIHWFKTVRASYKWEYQECRCGKRRCIDRLSGVGLQPVDSDWLNQLNEGVAE